MDRVASCCARRRRRPRRAPTPCPVRATGTTLRERLAQHASVEPCRSCHLLFDPLGLGLENFDPIGRWRDSDDGRARRCHAASCRAPIWRSTARPRWPQALQKDPRFARCLTRKLLTFALGRGMEPADAPALEYLTSGFAGGGYRFRDLVETIASSPLMTMRGGRSEP